MEANRIEQIAEEQLALEGLGLGSCFPINEYSINLFRVENHPHDYDPFFDDYE